MGANTRIIVPGQQLYNVQDIDIDGELIAAGTKFKVCRPIDHGIGYGGSLEPISKVISFNGILTMGIAVTSPILDTFKRNTSLQMVNSFIYLPLDCLRLVEE